MYRGESPKSVATFGWKTSQQFEYFIYVYMMIKSIQIDRASQSEFAIDST